jgi:hypothetical protein
MDLFWFLVRNPRIALIELFWFFLGVAIVLGIVWLWDILSGGEPYIEPNRLWIIPHLLGWVCPPSTS